MFRTVKLRGRKPGCIGCGSPGEIANMSSAVPNGDSVQFCGVQEEDSDERVSAKDLQEVINSDKPYVLIDTRPEVEYGSISEQYVRYSSVWTLITKTLVFPDIPHSKLLRNPELLEQAIQSDENTYFVCRRGNDSLLDARLAKGIVTTKETCTSQIRDLRGGLKAWHRLHPEFPLY
jgi:adenylyltransferase/sulfurtransferase